jgi:hypothetical protein
MSGPRPDEELKLIREHNLPIGGRAGRRLPLETVG